MKKILFLISLCAWIVGCSDSPSDGPKEPVQAIDVPDSLYVRILHYNGTDNIFELAAYQDSYLFSGTLGDGDRHTIERNFYVDTVVFDVSPSSSLCKDSSSLTYKIDGKKVETVESKWGRQALPLPDEEKHTVEISTASTCNQTTVTFDIVPSEKPGKIFKHVDRFYLSFFPNIRELTFKNGSLFYTITPSVTAAYYAGDTTLSRCKLMSGEDSLIIPVTFDKYKKRLGTLARINADSTKLTPFTDAHKDFSLACALYYQSWKVPAKVDSVQYFQAFPVSFKKTIEAPYIGERDGRIDILREDDLLSYFVIMRAHKRGTDEVVHKIYYSYIQDTLRVNPSWFLPQDSVGCPVDIDSIYAYTLPFVLATPESYELWEYLYSKYAISCLDGKWCPENADMKQDFDTTLAKLFTKHDGMDPHTWMSAFAWERDPPGPCELPKSSSSSEVEEESSSSSAFEECSDANLGKMVVDEDSSIYVCENGKWRDAEYTEMEIMRSCTKANDKERYEKKSKYRTSNGMLICKNSMWYAVTIYDDDITDYTNPDIAYRTFVDARDNHSYKIVDIGTQTWFAENLAYTNDTLSGASCYEDNPKNCKIGGVQYLWSTAMNLPSKYQIELATEILKEPVQGLCPDGWRIPSKEDWDILTEYAQNNSKAESSSDALKAKNAWNFDDYDDISDEFGFSAIPASENGDAYYASSTETNDPKKGVFDWGLSTFEPYPSRGYSFMYDTKYLVRCLKNKE
jgi:uncharacterized protein (TIGR02145 family)